MLLSKHEPSMTISNQTDRNGNNIQKPTCVLDYNQNMRGVDTSDQLNKYYDLSRKTMKWWVKLLFYLINTAVTNAYILYRKKRLHHMLINFYYFELNRLNKFKHCTRNSGGIILYIRKHVVII